LVAARWRAGTAATRKQQPGSSTQEAAPRKQHPGSSTQEIGQRIAARMVEALHSRMAYFAV
jgi:hypothetical protein